ncbi:PAS domain-containing protein [Paracoccus caeni]|uniref:PAS domain-containing protein n=1 Tax=Paracoccus caeni TaxID=657651 RepID=A0A934SDG0_9RHOB|nr:PAS domain-containing protein [Paracoccus caeni]MBK4215319.1 PAS domain-containing protein [Paracoccus caeni]
MADFDPARPTRIVAEIKAYWQGLRRGKTIPSRADIDPKGMHRVLDHAFILERMAPGAARFRLAGRHLIDLMGMEVRGMPLCAVMNPSSRGRLSDVLEAVFKAPQLADLTLHARAEYGRPEISARLLLLPLRSDLGDVTRALGCLASEGRVGFAPRRFDLIGEEMQPVIEGGRTIEPSPSCYRHPSATLTSRVRKQGPHGMDSMNLRQAPVLDAGGHDPVTQPEERRALFRIVSTKDDAHSCSQG